MLNKRTQKRSTKIVALWMVFLILSLCLVTIPHMTWAEETPESPGWEDEASGELAPPDDTVAEGEEVATDDDVALTPEDLGEVEEEVDPLSPEDEDGQSEVEALQVPAPINGIPAMYLTIDPAEYQKMIESERHEYRASGATISLYVPSGYTGEFSEKALTDIENLSLEYIRGRGNSTWEESKKPFKFKLNTKANLLGMGKGKHWVLLANSYDDTLLRNKIAAYMGRRLGLAYTPKMESIDLYVNDEYLGNYVLCPDVRIDGTSVDIDELGAANINEPEVTGGYLLALEPYFEEAEINALATTHGVRFFFDKPDFSEMGDQVEARDAQRSYISSYLQKVEDALFADGMTDADGKPYSNYMDLQSAASYWWVQEFSMNGDAFATPSTYLYKERDGKLYWGPLWDFDQAFSTWYEPEEMETLNSTKRMRWLDRMRAHDAGYQELLRSTWSDLDGIIGDITASGGVLDQYAAEIKASWIANYGVWGSEDDLEDDDEAGQGGGGVSQEEAEAAFNQKIEDLRTFLNNRRAAINKVIGTQIDDVTVTVRFLVDDEPVKTVEIRRGTMLDPCDFPSDPVKDGFHFMNWETEDGEEAIEASFHENGDVHAEFIANEDVTGPTGLFFPFYDVWEGTDSTYMRNGVVIVPTNAIDKSLTWTSSDPTVASIYDQDYIEIHKVGTTEITCTSSNGLSASFTLHVYDGESETRHDIEDFTLESDRLELKVGEFGQVRASASPQPASGSLLYESSDPSVAELVSEESGVVEAIGPGTCTITVRNEDGSVERQYTVVVTGDSSESPTTEDPTGDDDETPERTPEDPGPFTVVPSAAVSYTCTSDKNISWTKGDDKPLVLTFKRSSKDEETLDHFKGIKVDDEKVDAENYKASRGSVVLELKPEYLEELSVDKHTLTALFDDGSAKVEFTVKAAGSGGSGAPAPRNPTTRGVSRSSLARTGDDTPVGVTAALGLGALVVLAGGFQMRRTGDGHWG